jgi:hypothetical protein
MLLVAARSVINRNKISKKDGTNQGELFVIVALEQFRLEGWLELGGALRQRCLVDLLQEEVRCWLNRPSYCC